MNATAGSGSNTGGPGGNGVSTHSDGSGGGGAGNGGGLGKYSTGGNYPNADGDDGTGGVIILIVGGNLTIGSGGSVKANGSGGGNSNYPSEYDKDSSYTALGGGSGGGVCLVLYKGTLSNNGTVQASGGAKGTEEGYDGGDGGAGWVCIEQVD